MKKSEKIFRVVIIAITLAGLIMMASSLIYATGNGPIFWDHLGLAGVFVLSGELIVWSILLIGGCLPGQYGKVEGWGWALLPLGLGTAIMRILLTTAKCDAVITATLWGIPLALQVVTLTAVLAVVGLALQAITSRIRLA